MTPRPAYTLDAYALLAFFNGEPGGVAVQRFITAAERGETRLHLHLVNLGEVYYSLYRRRGEAVAVSRYVEVRRSRVRLHGLTEPILLTAGRFKARYPLSYADAFAAATAFVTETPLVTGDREFQALEAEDIIAVHWLE